MKPESVPVPPESPKTPSSKSPAPRQRNGSVARLPKAVRTQINQMLDDSVPHPEIIENLGEYGKGLHPDHIRRWKAGGYQDYLREQRLLAQCRLRHDRAFDLLRDNNPINGFQATQQIAHAQLCEHLADVGPAILGDPVVAHA